MQAYVPGDRFEDYKAGMEKIFGEASVTVLSIRPVGAEELQL
jgi:hypothetical protein